MRVLAMVGLAAAALLGPCPPPAVAADEAGAAEIRQGLERLVGRYSRLGEILPAELLRVEAAGPLVVRPKGDAYAAALPAVTLSLGDGLIATEIPAVGLRLSPLGEARYAADWQLPLRLDIALPLGWSMTVEAARLDASSVFAADLGLFLDYDVEGEALAVTGPGLSVAVDRFATSTDSRDLGDGVYDVFSTTLIENETFTLPTPDGLGSQTTTIGRASFESAVHGLRLEDTLDVSEAALAWLVEAVSAAGDPAAEAALMAELAALLDATPRLFDRITGRQVQEDLVVEDPMVNLAIGEIAADYALEHRAGGLGASLVYSVRAASLPGLAGPASELVPTGLDVRLTADLPAALVESTLAAFLDAGGRRGFAAAFDAAGRALDKAMPRSGMSFGLAAEVAAPAYALTLDGQARADAAAALGVTAKTTLILAGLEAATERLEAVPGGGMVIGLLTLLQTLGAPDRTEEGTPARRYDFRLARDGRVRLNGTDLEPLLGTLD